MLSVAIVCKNSERTIEKCLKSVTNLADEIIVVDAGSTDNTVRIAESLGGKVTFNPWRGYSHQKNFALSLCTGDWIVSLDSDEEVSEKLSTSIKNAIQSSKDAGDTGFEFNRRIYYLGKFLKYMWQPEWRLRLFRKGAAALVGEPHDSFVCEGRVQKLEGDLYHYSFSGVEEHVIKSINFAKLTAETLAGAEKHAVIKLFINPLWTFVKLYILKKGFLDGYRGFMASAVQSFYVFLKYAFIIEKKLGI